MFLLGCIILFLNMWWGLFHYLPLQSFGWLRFFKAPISILAFVRHHHCIRNIISAFILHLSVYILYQLYCFWRRIITPNFPFYKINHLQKAQVDKNYIKGHDRRRLQFNTNYSYDLITVYSWLQCRSRVKIIGGAYHERQSHEVLGSPGECSSGKFLYRGSLK